MEKIVKNLDYSKKIDKEPSLRYFLCSIPRSGTNFLATLISSTELLGNPFEYFTKKHNQYVSEKLNVTDQTKLLEKMYRHLSTPNGVFGSKLFYHQFAWHPEVLDTNIMLSGFKFIYLERRDRIAQAISWTIADQTRSFTSQQEDKKEPVYNYYKIKSFMHTIAKEYSSWEMYFSLHNIKPLRIYYEDIIENPAQTINEIANYLGVELDPSKEVTSVLKKQRNSLNSDWYERFKKEYIERGDDLIFFEQGVSKWKRWSEQLKVKILSRL